MGGRSTMEMAEFSSQSNLETAKFVQNLQKKERLDELMEGIKS